MLINSKNRYGQLPELIGFAHIQLTEMMFYQDMPIKMINGGVKFEKRLSSLSDLIFAIIDHFCKTSGVKRFNESYVYVSAKHLFQPKKEPYNRPGWHCDGFMSEDINYIWSDKYPTVFNVGQFKLTQDDALSIREMEVQALPENNMTYPVNSILRLDQYNVHRVADVEEPGMRAFVKITFSYDKYDLIGNTHNHELNYDWEMKPRSAERNIPQSVNAH